MLCKKINKQLHLCNKNDLLSRIILTNNVHGQCTKALNIQNINKIDGINDVFSLKVIFIGLF